MRDSSIFRCLPTKSRDITSVVNSQVSAYLGIQKVDFETVPYKKKP